MPDSSTKPLPPKHSSASPVWGTARLHSQYLATAVPMRLNAAWVVVVVGAGQAHRGDRRRLGLEREVGEHVAHQRLVGQQLAEGGAVGGVPGGLLDRDAHAGRGADHAVQPGVSDHLDDRGHAAALLAQAPGPGAVELDLAGGVGAVAELVLQALQVEGVAAAVGRKRGRTKQVRPPSACASTRKASHIGAEQNHLWPVELVLAVADGLGAA